MSSNEKAEQQAAGETGAPPVPINVVAQAAAAAEGNSEQRQTPQRQDQPEDADADPPPPYGEDFANVTQEDDNAGVNTKATVNADGRVDISINQHSNRLSAIFQPVLQTQIDSEEQEPLPPPYIPPSLGGEPGQRPPPPLNVAIHVVGSRGDVQPFVALGKVLKETYGHRVRLATHPTFQSFVLENGLEFFSIGGDPAQLMAFMVKNPGLMPGFDTITSGDVGKRRAEISRMIKGCWRSCIETGDGTGVEASDTTVEGWMSSSSESVGSTEPSARPFVADAIIANPPSFAHVHCAEKLGCPLHIMFTMPYSPTQAFPHPLANIQSTNADTSITNYLTYGLVDMMTWQGLGDVVNRFRQKSLGLLPINLILAPGMLARLRVPHTYCWSPALIPKPKDWSSHISISGFYFLSLASTYTPDTELANFLAAGPPPVYIGFGSIVVDDPNAMTEMVFDAVRRTGQRALVSKGWGGMGADELGVPDNVIMLGNVPHDWLFQHVSCVVHHGGAGTTAAGIAAAKPTVIVPFFGDQPFWGAMIAKAGAGPEPIAYKDLDAEKLAASINFALAPTTVETAKQLATRIQHENGCQTGAQSFHQQMDVDTVRCSLAPSRAAVWRLRKTNVRLSALAATALANQGLLDFKDLKLFRSHEYETDAAPLDPVSGATSALVGTGTSIFMGFADFPARTMMALNVHPDSKKKGKQRETSVSEGAGQKPADGNQTPKTSTTSGPYLDSRSSTDDLSTIATQSSDDVSVQTARSQPMSPPLSTASQSQFNLSESLAGMHDPADQNASQHDVSSQTGSSGRANFVDQLSNQLSRATSGSQDSAPSSQSKNPTSPLERKYSETLETVLGTSKGVGRMLDASFRSPMDFTNALARGFHNAPKLYGDDTVRKEDRVNDFKSGIRAAGKGFGFGLYDGITGMVTQPISGAKKDGAAGFLKGVGKGIGGLILKPQAAVFGLPGYVMKGVYSELSALNGKSTQNYIIAARTAQGYEDWHNSSPQERKDIESRWRQLQQVMKKKGGVDSLLQDWGQVTKNKSASATTKPSARMSDTRKKILDHLERTDLRAFMQQNRTGGTTQGSAGAPASQPPAPRQSAAARDAPTSARSPEPHDQPGLPRDDSTPAVLSSEKTLSAPAESTASTPSDVDVLTPASSLDLPRTEVTSSSTSTLQPRPSSNSKQDTSEARHSTDEYDADLEAAIKASLAQASTGSSEDDAALEAAIRASVAQLEHGSPTVTAAFDAARDKKEESAAINAAMQTNLHEWERSKGTGAKQGQKAVSGKHSYPEAGTGAMSKSWDGQEHGVASAKTGQGAPKTGSGTGQAAHDGDGADDDDEQAALAEAIKRSLADHRAGTPTAAPTESPAPRGTGSTGADDAGGSSREQHEDEIERAIQASLAEQQGRDRERSEEEIVLAYVQKLSLLEEEHRQKVLSGDGSGGASKGGSGETSGTGGGQGGSSSST